MFKNDRLPFFFHSVYRMFPHDIPENEMNVFLDNSSYQGVNDSNIVDLPGWIPTTSVYGIRNLKASYLLSFE